MSKIQEHVSAATLHIFLPIKLDVLTVELVVSNAIRQVVSIVKADFF